MSKPRPSYAFSLSVLLLLAQCGCVSLVPRQNPGTLYRFGDQSAPATATSPGPARPPLDLHVDLPSAAAGDGVLTVTGARAAYLDGARWVTPASVIFRDDLTLALLSRSGFEPLDRTDRASLHLSVHVLRFEVDYKDGAEAAPTIHVTATLTLRNDASAIQPVAMIVNASSLAAENRVSAIVSAYGEAVREVTDAAVTLVNAQSPLPTATPHPG